MVSTLRKKCWYSFMFILYSMNSKAFYIWKNFASYFEHRFNIWIPSICSSRKKVYWLTIKYAPNTWYYFNAGLQALPDGNCSAHLITAWEKSEDKISMTGSCLKIPEGILKATWYKRLQCTLKMWKFYLKKVKLL